MDFCRESQGDIEYHARIYGGNTRSKIGRTIYKRGRIGIIFSYSQRIPMFDNIPRHNIFVWGNNYNLQLGHADHEQNSLRLHQKLQI